MDLIEARDEEMQKEAKKSTISPTKLEEQSYHSSPDRDDPSRKSMKSMRSAARQRYLEFKRIFSYRPFNQKKFNISCTEGHPLIQVEAKVWQIAASMKTERIELDKLKCKSCNKKILVIPRLNDKGEDLDAQYYWYACNDYFRADGDIYYD